MVSLSHDPLAQDPLAQDPLGGAPDPRSLVEWLATTEGIGHHELTDGRYTVSYAQVPQLLDRLDEHFRSHDVAPSRAVVLECSQSVAGALAILYLLSRGYDVVFMPEPGQQSKEGKAQRFVPGFCSHVVTALDLEPQGDGSESMLRSFEIAPNREYAPEPAMTHFTGPDLYLRTSGSTGVPKLTRMSHQKWLNNAQPCVERWGLEAGDRLAVPVPIFHSYGFGAALLPGLLVGASMDLASGFNVLRFLERDRQFEPNVAFLTPGLCDTFLRLRKSSRRYKLAVTAGDKVTKETMAGFEERFGPLLNLYGSAEMGAVSSASPQDPFDQRIATAGYALSGIELRVEETEDETAHGNVGALHCRQRNGSAGYLIHQEGRWRFTPRRDDEWFPTGDLARIRDDGYVEILGRSGLSVKRDGLLVVFADVEASMERIEGLERVVVLAKSEGRRGSRIAAVCQAVAGHSPEPSDVRRRCFEELPSYAVPDQVVVVDSLPLLPSGKVDRRALLNLV